MPTYTHELQLMLFIMLIALISAIAWAVLSGIMQIAPQTSKRFSVANLLLFFGITLLIFRQETPHILFWHGSDFLILSAFILLKHGLSELFKRPYLLNADLAVMALWLLLALPLQGGIDDLEQMTVLFLAAASLWMVQATAILYMATRRNFAFHLAVGATIPLAGLGLVFVTQLVLLITPSGYSPPSPVGDDTGIFWGYLIFTLLVNVAMFTSVVVRLVAKIRYLAERDQLTGLYNRFALNRFLQQQHNLWQRHRTPYALLICDLDHFKQLNDKHGHLAGDSALRNIARVLISNVRAEDVCGRFGGEEFLILLPLTTLESAQRTAQKLVEQIEKTELMLDGQVVQITCSIGYCAIQPTLSSEDMLRLADKALYQAKAAGRNRVQEATIPFDQPTAIDETQVTELSEF
jgi:diguanylate cyclase (GGDEF)-like protein